MQDLQISSTAAIILAAGSSSRMGAGRHKLLLPLGDEPVLVHVIKAAVSSGARPIVVVLGHQAESARAAIPNYATVGSIYIPDENGEVLSASTDMAPTLHIIENPDYLDGMSTSIRAGIQELIKLAGDREQPIDSALILLGDQPLMTSSIIDRVIATRHTTGKPIITPLYKGTRGNPTLFASNLFPELLEISGDEGARSVIQRHRQQVATIELGDALPIYDVDTWDAYQQVLTEWQRKQEEARDINGYR